MDRNGRWRAFHTGLVHTQIARPTFELAVQGAIIAERESQMKSISIALFLGRVIGNRLAVIHQAVKEGGFSNVHVSFKAYLKEFEPLTLQRWEDWRNAGLAKTSSGDKSQKRQSIKKSVDLEKVTQGIILDPRDRGILTLAIPDQRYFLASITGLVECSVSHFCDQAKEKGIKSTDLIAWEVFG